MLELVSSVRISNLGCIFFPSKDALGNPYLSCLRTDVSEILVDFRPRFYLKVYLIANF